MPRPLGDLPDALDQLDTWFAEWFANGAKTRRNPVVFCDYDGTLTPIVEHPDLAILDQRTRVALRELSARCPVAIISGRDLDDVRRHLDLEHLIMAGSHGFDIAGPGWHHHHPVGESARPALAEVADRLDTAIGHLPGVLIEPKRFAVAVHTRRVGAAHLDRVEQAVDEVARRVAGLRRTSGKMIHEFRPDIDWNKGSALWFVYEEMDLDPNTSVPIYLGDDDTDEDALAAIATGGIGIFVGDDLSRLTSASYRLDDPAAVTRLLEELAVRLDLRD